METPLSSRRITRSMAATSASASASASHKVDSSWAAKNAPDAQAAPRAALHDITNDSPIVGLAAAGLRTPASTAAKTRPRPRCTPGSGEALLRGQVKTLLQKVNEEGCAAAAPVVRIQALLGVARSPAHLLAPTPANTPQIGPLTASTAAAVRGDGFTVVPCVLEEEELLPKLQVIAAVLPSPPAPMEESLGESQLNRALVFDDSPEKSDVSASSLAFHQLSSSSERSPDDDSSSAWSIQANASSEKELGEEEEEEEEWLEEEEEADDDDDECFDDLCEGMSKMSVFDAAEDEEDRVVELPAFEGRHTRFIYSGDGDGDDMETSEVLVLRGLPVPEGKHLRFHEEGEEEEE